MYCLFSNDRTLVFSANTYQYQSLFGEGHNWNNSGGLLHGNNTGGPGPRPKKIKTKKIPFEWCFGFQKNFFRSGFSFICEDLFQGCAAVCDGVGMCVTRLYRPRENPVVFGNHTQSMKPAW